jgi:hypothetical protein
MLAGMCSACAGGTEFDGTNPAPPDRYLASDIDVENLTLRQEPIQDISSRRIAVSGFMHKYALGTPTLYFSNGSDFDNDTRHKCIDVIVTPELSKKLKGHAKGKIEFSGRLVLIEKLDRETMSWRYEGTSFTPYCHFFYADRSYPYLVADGFR